jgi:hypothetical protein
MMTFFFSSFHFGDYQSLVPTPFLFKEVQKKNLIQSPSKAGLELLKAAHQSPTTSQQSSSCLKKKAKRNLVADEHHRAGAAPLVGSSPTVRRLTAPPLPVPSSSASISAVSSKAKPGRRPSPKRKYSPLLSPRRSATRRRRITGRMSPCKPPCLPR